MITSTNMFFITNGGHRKTPINWQSPYDPLADSASISTEAWPGVNNNVENLVKKGLDKVLQAVLEMRKSETPEFDWYDLSDHDGDEMVQPEKPDFCAERPRRH